MLLGIIESSRLPMVPETVGLVRVTPDRVLMRPVRAMAEKFSFDLCSINFLSVSTSARSLESELFETASRSVWVRPETIL